MAGTVDFDRLEYEKRVNLVIDHVSAHLAEDLSSSPPTSPGTSGSTSWTCREARWRSAPGSGYEPADRPCLEVYRGNPEVAGRPGAFRCELCIPVRPR
ncbi:MAG: hypothetical protein DME07_06790 [Candidatus Rokuibacteriota bacterium]|nr:MAG: hypothetical protein DME07_06790 [Candidatus Rokubacteria bacterium]